MRQGDLWKEKISISLRHILSLIFGPQFTVFWLRYEMTINIYKPVQQIVLLVSKEIKILVLLLIWMERPNNVRV